MDLSAVGVYRAKKKKNTNDQNPELGYLCTSWASSSRPLEFSTATETDHILCSSYHRAENQLRVISWRWVIVLGDITNGVIALASCELKLIKF